MKTQLAGRNSEIPKRKGIFSNRSFEYFHNSRLITKAHIAFKQQVEPFERFEVVSALFSNTFRSSFFASTSFRLKRFHKLHEGIPERKRECLSRSHHYVALLLCFLIQ
jgi:hypothetical protein